MSEEHIDWKSRALAAEAETLNLKNLCAHHGICTACGEYYSHRYIEPFATCNCNTSEWYELTEYMKLQDELRKLRKQEPVAWCDADGDFYSGESYPNVWPSAIPLYASPVPAPAVPTDEQIHTAYRNALGQSVRERDMPEIRKFAHALLQSSRGEK